MGPPSRIHLTVSGAAVCGEVLTVKKQKRIARRHSLRNLDDFSAQAALRIDSESILSYTLLLFYRKYFQPRT